MGNISLGQQNSLKNRLINHKKRENERIKCLLSFSRL